MRTTPVARPDTALVGSVNAMGPKSTDLSTPWVTAKLPIEGHLPDALLDHAELPHLQRRADLVQPLRRSRRRERR